MKTAPHQLTAILERAGKALVAYCPELDLAVEAPESSSALKELCVAAKEYAEEYAENRDLYERSPNRSAHKPYIEAILKKRSAASVRGLFGINLPLPAAK